MKVAIIHYWFITRRGGEKVVESILKLYPQADIYTLFYDRNKYGDYLNNNKIYTSKYDIPFFRRHYQKLFPIYPSAIRSLKLRDDYDLVISSESGPAKGVKINNSAIHVCYIHSPMRYCWGHTDEYLRVIHPILRPLVNYLFKRLRKWDYGTKDNVDYYIANSRNIAKRVKKYYNKNADVIYPPISSKIFKNEQKLKNKKKHFLSFGALTPYKRIELLVDCFNLSGDSLVIIGEGSEKEKLEKKANKNIKFKGFLNELELQSYIQNSKALIFPGEEDFGMIPLEVMAFGIPVIAYKKGGALETVIEKKENIKESSGLFFKEQNINELQKSINYFKKIEEEFNPAWIISHAKKFEETVFLHRFSEKINKLFDKK